MVESIRWTLRAIQETEDWLKYLSQYNVKAANLAATQLVRRTHQLIRFNALGRIGSVSGTRELSLPKWKKVVVYSISDDHVEIITLRDTRQNPLS